MNENLHQNSQMMRPVIRVGRNTLSFTHVEKDGSVNYAPYTVKSGVSMAANLRTAFRSDISLPGDTKRILLMINSPVVLVPLDEYMDAENYDTEVIYSQTFPGHDNDIKVANVLPDLNAVAIFAVNKDLALVLTDHFADVKIRNVMEPVWAHLYRRSILVNQRRKLYACFHDQKMDVFSFQQHRFRFSNSFDAAHAHDALYFLLYAWKQLAFSEEDDELHIVGSTPHQEWLLNKLRQYLKKAYIINPSADLNRSAASQVINMEYDLMLLS